MLTNLPVYPALTSEIYPASRLTVASIASPTNDTESPGDQKEFEFQL